MCDGGVRADGAPPHAPRLLVALSATGVGPPCAAASNCSQRGGHLSARALLATSSQIFCALVVTLAIGGRRSAVQISSAICHGAASLKNDGPL